MGRDVNAGKYEDGMCISYLDIQGFSKMKYVPEHVNWQNELKELCLIAVGYTCKIYGYFYFKE